MGANSNTRTNTPTQVPAMPAIPAGASPELRKYLETLSQVVSIRLGRRGDPRDRAVTMRELIDSGLATELATTPFDPNRSGNAGFAPFGQFLTDLAVPPAPTGFTANGAYSQINLNWNYPAYSNHSHTEVHVHTSDVIGDATLLGIQTGTVFVDPVGSGQTRYYWVRHVNTKGFAGPFNSASGTAATTATDVNHMLGVLATAITSSELANELSTPIAKIDPLETFTGYSSSYSGNSLLTRMGAVETTASGAATSAQLTSEQTTRASADTALSQSITTVSTTVAGNTAAVSAAATSIDGLEAQYTVKIDLNGAVAGYGLASTTTAAGNITSEFIVNADRFAIMRGGSNTATATVPFVVQASATTLNGESVPAGVYMADAFIKNGSIASAKIGTLAADKISSGFISTDRLQGNSIEATKLKLDSNYMSVNSSNQLELVTSNGSTGIKVENLSNDAVGTIHFANGGYVSAGNTTYFSGSGLSFNDFTSSSPYNQHSSFSIYLPLILTTTVSKTKIKESGNYQLDFGSQVIGTQSGSGKVGIACVVKQSTSLSFPSTAYNNRSTAYMFGGEGIALTPLTSRSSIYLYKDYNYQFSIYGFKDGITSSNSQNGFSSTHIRLFRVFSAT